MADEANEPTADELARAESAVDRVLNELVGDLNAATLAGDLHNKIMAHIRAVDGFAALSEMRQDAIIRGTDDLARQLVISVVELVADSGFAHIEVKLGKFTLNGEELKGTFEGEGTDNIVLQLARHQGKTALIVFADAKDFLGSGGNKPRAAPDEPGLPLEQPTPQATGMDDVEQADLPDGPIGETGTILPATDADPVAAAAAAAWSEEDGAGEKVTV